MQRRTFVKNTGMLAAAVTAAGSDALTLSPSATPRAKNKLPKWKGFNLLDFFSPNPAGQRIKTTEEHLKWMRDWGFDFVRVPMAYPSYLKFDRSRPIKPEEVGSPGTELEFAL